MISIISILLKHCTNTIKERLTGKQNFILDYFFLFSQLFGLLVEGSNISLLCKQEPLFQRKIIEIYMEMNLDANSYHQATVVNAI